ncbi:hypothetical protein Peur_047620 [Populus x canadensis]
MLNVKMTSFMDMKTVSTRLKGTPSTILTHFIACQLAARALMVDCNSPRLVMIYIQLLSALHVDQREADCLSNDHDWASSDLLGLWALSSFGCIWLPARRLKLAVRATIFIYKEFNDIFFY